MRRNCTCLIGLEGLPISILLHVSYPGRRHAQERRTSTDLEFRSPRITAVAVLVFHPA